MSRLELFLFGSPRLTRHERVIEIDARKTVALLSYLAVSGQPIRRELIINLLWPELDTRRGQNVLRRNLSVLNKSLQGDWLLVEKDTIALDPTANAFVDVVEFRRLASNFHNHDHDPAVLCEDCFNELTRAVDLYTADFLSGFGIRNSINFDNWQSVETEQLKRELTEILTRLVHGYKLLRKWKEAIPFAKRMVGIDPLNELFQRELIQLYAKDGDRSSALKQYQQCVQLLEDELGVPPEPETIELYESLLQTNGHQHKQIGENYAIPDGQNSQGLRNSLIGSGAMGHVYRGVDRSSGSPVAIKILKPEIITSDPGILKRFVREGELLQQLNHPHIVKMHQAVEQGNDHCLIMEFVGGGSLQELIERHETLSVEHALRIALDLADALTRAHKLNVIHRDLKPSNILLTENGSPKLSDFGIARQTKDTTQLTATGMIIGTPNYLSPEVIEGHTPDERSDIWAFGIILFEMLSGIQPFRGNSLTTTFNAILTKPPADLSQMRNDIPVELWGLIQHMLEKDPAQRIGSVRQIGLVLEQLMLNQTVEQKTRLVPNGPPPPCPYRGLFAFQIEDAPFFFGRETFAKQLVSEVESHPLIAVVGPSGSGKSSVVFAGLLAKLRQSSDAITAVFRPGPDPFQSLSAALLPLLQEELSEVDQLLETKKLAKGFQSGELSLDSVVDRIVSKESNGKRKQLFVVADQFEELFTLSSAPENRELFLDLILDCVELQTFKKEIAFHFVLTMRADFLEQALAYRPLADILQDSTIMLGPMDRDELARAIEQPAEIQGVSFEPGLVERLLNDVGEDAGNLPLLEFALTTLWAYQERRVLTHNGYDAIGRVSGALTSHAEETIESLNAVELEATRRIMIQLVQPGEGTEDTRRIAYKAELDESDWLIVQQLADSRLLITGRNPSGNETVEVVHEALIRSWSRLREWMRIDRTFRIWQERLRSAVHQWQSANQDEGALFRGRPLVEAEGWLIDRPENISSTEKQFIQTSLDLRSQQTARAEKARIEREKLRQRVLTASITGLVIALLFAGLAGFQWQRAAQGEQTAINAQATAAAERDQSQLSQSKQLAALTVTQLDTQLDLATLLSLEATNISNSSQARSALRDSLTANPAIAKFMWGHTDFVTSVAFSPDGQLIASGSNDDTIILRDISSGQLILPPLTGHNDNVIDLAFSDDGRWIISASHDNTIRIWEVTTGLPIGSPLTDHNERLQAVEFSPDGRRFASVGEKKILVWEFTDGTAEVNLSLEKGENIVQEVAFSPDGQRMASGGEDQSIFIWDLSSGSPSQKLIGHQDIVRSISFSPDGQILASASENGEVIVWELQSSDEPIQQFKAHDGSVRSISFSPESSENLILATAGIDGALRFWNPLKGEMIHPSFVGHSDWIRSIDFDPLGTQIASASHDGSIILWDLSDSSPDPFFIQESPSTHQGSIRTIAFHPDGGSYASAGDDQNIILWSFETVPPKTQRIISQSETILSLSYSPFGNMLVAGGEEGGLTVWDLDSPTTSERSLFGHVASIHTIDFHPEGHMFASADNDGIIFLWDTETFEVINILDRHTGRIERVAFSPTGQFLASASDDNSIILWEIGDDAEPTVKHILLGHNDVVFDLAFSPDEQSIVSSSWDRSLILWDIDTGRVIGAPMRAHIDSIESVAFSIDGNTIASGGWDNTIILWDAADQEPLGPPLIGHEGSVRVVRFSPDGRHLLSGSDDGSIGIWDVDLSSWQEKACGRANRNFTIDEWQQIFGGQEYETTCPDLPFYGN